MNEAKIKKYAQLMQELGLTGLEITEEGCTVRLEREAAPVAVAAPVPAAAPASKPEKKYKSICSPTVGVFYAAPAENAEPFVKVGDRVKRGDTLCIIEAMKLMNELTAEEDGVIAEICVQNGQVVDYGCELFRLEGDAL